MTKVHPSSATANLDLQSPFIVSSFRKQLVKEVFPAKGLKKYLADSGLYKKTYLTLWDAKEDKKPKLRLKLKALYSKLADYEKTVVDALQARISQHTDWLEFYLVAVAPIFELENFRDLKHLQNSLTLSMQKRFETALQDQSRQDRSDVLKHYKQTLEAFAKDKLSKLSSSKEAKDKLELQGLLNQFRKVHNTTTSSEDFQDNDKLQISQLKHNQLFSLAANAARENDFELFSLLASDPDLVNFFSCGNCEDCLIAAAQGGHLEFLKQAFQTFRYKISDDVNLAAFYLDDRTPKTPELFKLILNILTPTPLHDRVKSTSQLSEIVFSLANSGQVQDIKTLLEMAEEKGFTAKKIFTEVMGLEYGEKNLLTVALKRKNSVNSLYSPPSEDEKRKVIAQSKELTELFLSKVPSLIYFTDPSPLKNALLEHDLETLELFRTNCDPIDFTGAMHAIKEYPQESLNWIAQHYPQAFRQEARMTAIHNYECADLSLIGHAKLLTTALDYAAFQMASRNQRKREDEAQRQKDSENFDIIAGAAPQFSFSAKTSGGQNPLHVAAMFGDAEFAERLLTMDPALATAFDSNGFAPIHYAIYARKKDVVDVFVKKLGAEALQVKCSGNVHSVINEYLRGGNIFHVVVMERIADDFVRRDLRITPIYSYLSKTILGEGYDQAAEENICALLKTYPELAFQPNDDGSTLDDGFTPIDVALNLKTIHPLLEMLDALGAELEKDNRGLAILQKTLKDSLPQDFEMAVIGFFKAKYPELYAGYLLTPHNGSTLIHSTLMSGNISYAQKLLTDLPESLITDLCDAQGNNIFHSIPPRSTYSAGPKISFIESFNEPWRSRLLEHKNIAGIAAIDRLALVYPDGIELRPQAMQRLNDDARTREELELKEGENILHSLIRRKFPYKKIEEILAANPQFSTPSLIAMMLDDDKVFFLEEELKAISTACKMAQGLDLNEKRELLKKFQKQRKPELVKVLAIEFSDAINDPEFYRALDDDTVMEIMDKRLDQVLVTHVVSRANSQYSLNRVLSHCLSKLAENLIPGCNPLEVAMRMKTTKSFFEILFFDRANGCKFTKALTASQLASAIAYDSEMRYTDVFARTDAAKLIAAVEERPQIVSTNLLRRLLIIEETKDFATNTFLAIMDYGMLENLLREQSWDLLNIAFSHPKGIDLLADYLDKNPNKQNWPDLVENLSKEALGVLLTKKNPLLTALRTERSIENRYISGAVMFSNLAHDHPIFVEYLDEKALSEIFSTTVDKGLVDVDPHLLLEKTNPEIVAKIMAEQGPKLLEAAIEKGMMGFYACVVEKFPQLKLPQHEEQIRKVITAKEMADSLINNDTFKCCITYDYLSSSNVARALTSVGDRFYDQDSIKKSANLDPISRQPITIILEGDHTCFKQNLANYVEQVVALLQLSERQKADEYCEKFSELRNSLADTSILAEKLDQALKTASQKKSDSPEGAAAAAGINHASAAKLKTRQTTQTKANL